MGRAEGLEFWGSAFFWGAVYNLQLLALGLVWWRVRVAFRGSCEGFRLDRTGSSEGFSMPSRIARSFSRKFRASSPLALAKHGLGFEAFEALGVRMSG